MNYRSLTDLNALVARSLHKLPRDLDLIVAIPRSGLLPAAMIALALNLPISDLEGFIAGRLLACGRTRRRDSFERGAGEARRVLVVDDSADTGTSLAEAKARLELARPDVAFTYLAAFASREGIPGLDLALEIIPQPRVFQWNALHHDQLASSCVDIDGVLCLDPSEEENDDGPAYLGFLSGAAPLSIPTRRVGTLVTNRLERYRPQTEAWLAASGVSYGRLVMLDLPSKAERLRLGRHGAFKGEVYRDSDATLFIESDPDQARVIAEVSGKPVLCVGDHRLYRASRLSPGTLTQRRRSMTRGIPRLAKGLLRRALGEGSYARLKRMVVGTR